MSNIQHDSFYVKAPKPADGKAYVGDAENMDFATKADIPPEYRFVGMRVQESISGVYKSYRLEGTDPVTDGTWVEIIDIGEANTMTNPQGGEGIFINKTGVNFNMKSIDTIDAETSGISVTSDQEAVLIVNTLIGSNLGTGNRIYNGREEGRLEFRTITEGDNIVITENTNDIIINAIGEANTMSNPISGEPIYMSKSGSNLFIRSLKAGTNITLVSDQDSITFDAIGEANIATNLPGDVGLYQGKTGSSLEFLSLTEGSNIELDATNNDEVIISTVGATGSWIAGGKVVTVVDGIVTSIVLDNP